MRLQKNVEWRRGLNIFFFLILVCSEEKTLYIHLNMQFCVYMYGTFLTSFPSCTKLLTTCNFTNVAFFSTILSQSWLCCFPKKKRMEKIQNSSCKNRKKKKMAHKKILEILKRRKVRQICVCFVFAIGSKCKIEETQYTHNYFHVKYSAQNVILLSVSYAKKKQIRLYCEATELIFAKIKR